MKTELTQTQQVDIETDFRKGTRFRIPEGISKDHLDILNYSISSFTFILKPGQYSYAEFANKIAENYDVNNTQTKETIRVLRLL